MWIPLAIVSALVGAGIVFCILAPLWIRQKSRANRYIVGELDRSNIVFRITDELNVLEQNQLYEFQAVPTNQKLHNACMLGMLETKAARQFFQDVINSYFFRWPDLEVVYQPIPRNRVDELDKCITIKRKTGWIWKILNQAGVELNQIRDLSHQKAFDLPIHRDDLPDEIQAYGGHSLVVVSPSGKIHRQIEISFGAMEEARETPVEVA